MFPPMWTSLIVAMHDIENRSIEAFRDVFQVILFSFRNVVRTKMELLLGPCGFRKIYRDSNVR